jgi:hypothetical protein
MSDYKITALLLTLAIVAGILASCTANNNNGSNNDNPGANPDVSLTASQPYEILEEQVIIGEGTQWELNGLLTLPEGIADKIPAVVIVHGTGALNMNGSWNDTDLIKPFKDIAEYLTTYGIAVLRYDKRTFTHIEAVSCRDFTVHEETVEDAILAADILRNDERIDNENIFIIGHSMGGMLTPRIDNEGGNFAGLIIMAGSPRTFYPEVWYSQMMEGNFGDIIERLAEFESLTNMTAEEAKELSFFGVTGYWIKNMNEYPSNEYLQTTDKPILIMQGEKDWLIFADKDFAAYKKLLDGNDNVTFKLYENLNHSFMAYISEYETADTKDVQMLRDIVDWIHSN